jgi:hypothetical protein
MQNWPIVLTGSRPIFLTQTVIDLIALGAAGLVMILLFGSVPGILLGIAVGALLGHVLLGVRTLATAVQPSVPAGHER